MLTLLPTEHMSAENPLNPFQIPTCFKLELEQRRRERFKKTVVTAVIVSIAVVVGLLIEGCVSERSAVTAPQATTQPAAPQNTAQNLPGEKSQSVSVTQANALPVQPCPVATVPKKTVTPVNPPPTTGVAVYLVKSGDSLARIAKTHGTTVKALKAANNLTTDKISVGEQLKVPKA